jgi:hypothetical protein
LASDQIFLLEKPGYFYPHAEQWLRPEHAQQLLKVVEDDAN